MMDQDKVQVHEFWDKASCGEGLYLHGLDEFAYQAQASKRYELEPYITAFAGFSDTRGLRVLEIGVGLGADHQKFAEAGAILDGIDLTERAITHTKQRFEVMGLSSRLIVGDAEDLHYEDDFFDVVYSWGVLHHSSNTPKAIHEVFRVLKKGGVAQIMIYNKWSMVGLMLWIRYALLQFRPWMSLSEIYARYLESPGTTAYTANEARLLFADFSEIDIQTVLTHGDLLQSEVGQRHRGVLLSLARKLWPRSVIRRFFPNAGLFMLIEAKK
jgi:ubiquinone/menaquinone biosynthesis C-methylase UbiE